jgi:hypothetical protein
MGGSAPEVTSGRAWAARGVENGNVGGRVCHDGRVGSVGNSGMPVSESPRVSEERANTEVLLSLHACPYHYRL